MERERRWRKIVVWLEKCRGGGENLVGSDDFSSQAHKWFSSEIALKTWKKIEEPISLERVVLLTRVKCTVPGTHFSISPLLFAPFYFPSHPNIPLLMYDKYQFLYRIFRNSKLIKFFMRSLMCDGCLVLKQWIYHKKV